MGSIKVEKVDSGGFFTFKVFSGTKEMFSYYERMRRILKGDNGVRFSLSATEDNMALLCTFENGEEFIPGIIPERLQALFRVVKIWDSFGKDIKLVAFSCGISKVGSEMGFRKWNKLMRMSDYGEVTGDFDRMTRDKFEEMMRRVNDKLSTVVYVTKLRFEFSNVDKMVPIEISVL